MKTTKNEDEDHGEVVAPDDPQPSSNIDPRVLGDDSLESCRTFTEVYERALLARRTQRVLQAQAFNFTRPEDAWTDNPRGRSLTAYLENRDAERERKYLGFFDILVAQDFLSDPLLAPSHEANRADTTIAESQGDVDIQRRYETVQAQNQDGETPLGASSFWPWSGEIQAIAAGRGNFDETGVLQPTVDNLGNNAPGPLPHQHEEGLLPSCETPLRSQRDIFHAARPLKEYLSSWPGIIVPPPAAQDDHATSPISVYPDPREHESNPHRGDYFGAFDDLRTQNTQSSHEKTKSFGQGCRGDIHVESRNNVSQVIGDNNGNIDYSRQPPHQLPHQLPVAKIQADSTPSSIPHEPDWNQLGPGGPGHWPREWIQLKKGRTDKKYPTHYPHGDMRIAGGHPLEAYCYYRPNHVWHDGLRPFINEPGWSGQRIWNAFPQDLRDVYRQADGRLHHRAQNWVQQAWCREKRAMEQEEIERHRVGGPNPGNPSEQPQRRPQPQRFPSVTNTRQQTSKENRPTVASLGLPLSSNSGSEVDRTSVLDAPVMSRYVTDGQAQGTSTNKGEGRLTPLNQSWWGPFLRHHIDRLEQVQRQIDPSFAEGTREAQVLTVGRALQNHFARFAQKSWNNIPLGHPHPWVALRAVYQQLLFEGRLPQTATEEQFCDHWMHFYLIDLNESLNDHERTLSSL